MRKPIHSDQKIIEVGESLRAKLGREITPTEIHKEFEGKGKYARIRDVWADHIATRDDEEAQNDIPLPDGAQDQIADAVTALERSVQVLVKDLIARMTAQHVRQYALHERDFARLDAEHYKKVQTLEAEIAYLTGCLDDLQEEEEVTGSVAPARTLFQVPVSAPAAPVVGRKPANRPVQKIGPPISKAGRPSSPKPKKAPGQPPTQS